MTTPETTRIMRAIPDSVDDLVDRDAIYAEMLSELNMFCAELMLEGRTTTAQRIARLIKKAKG